MPGNAQQFTSGSGRFLVVLQCAIYVTTLTISLLKFFAMVYYPKFSFYCPAFFLVLFSSQHLFLHIGYDSEVSRMHCSKWNDENTRLD